MDIKLNKINSTFCQFCYDEMTDGFTRPDNSIAVSG